MQKEVKCLNHPATVVAKTVNVKIATVNVKIAIVRKGNKNVQKNH